MKNKILTTFAVLATALAASGAPKAADGARAVITVVPGDHSHKSLTAADLQVTEEGAPARVTSVSPLAEQGLQLWILIDNSSEQSLSLQYNDIRKFIREQPSNTEIGIGYMQYGDVKKVQDLTTGRDLAAQALRIPLGRVTLSPSPYMSIEALVKKWPATNKAREVLLITSGIDPYGPGPDDPYLLGAIDHAQRAGVVVHSIYYGAAGSTGWQVTWGQNNLSRIDSATGGQFYWLGTTNPVSFAPFLNQLNERLSQQYIVGFESASGKTGLEKIKVTTELPDAKVVAPTRVYVGS